MKRSSLRVAAPARTAKHLEASSCAPGQLPAPQCPDLRTACVCPYWLDCTCCSLRPWGPDYHNVHWALLLVDTVRLLCCRNFKFAAGPHTCMHMWAAPAGTGGTLAPRPSATATAKGLP